MVSDFTAQWLEMLKSIGTRNMPWKHEGGNEWISYKQVDENDYKVQIFLHGDFTDYKRQKEAVVSFFDKRKSLLVEESQVKDVAFGYWKELHFIDESKVEQKKKEREAQPMSFLPIGSIYAPGGVVNFGSISASPISIDNSIYEIEKQIEELGGEDKAELTAFLEETKTMVEEYINAKQITPKPGFLERLNNHVVKHGWFYGAILQLVGTAALNIIT